MTVAELIDKLKKAPQDAQVMYAYDGGTRGVPDCAWVTKHGAVALGEDGDSLYESIDEPKGEPMKSNPMAVYSIDAESEYML